MFPWHTLRSHRAWETYAFDESWYYFINIREATTEQQEVRAALICMYRDVV